jgi:peroxiredoxin
VELQRHQAEFAARSIRVVGISVDPLDRSRDLARDLGLDFPLLSDPNLLVIRAYGVADESSGLAWPAEFLIDAGGRIRWRATAASVGTRPSAADVLRAFDAVAPGRGR